MKSLLALLLLLAGCASAPAVPDWRVNAHAALGNYTAAYFAGRERVARLELARARAEVARTGEASQMARVELVACALEVASLAATQCPAFQVLEQDADAAARAYADYLAGRWERLDAALLPPAQQGVPASRDALATLSAIEDPLSRLVAAALLLRAGRLPPAGIDLAIDTASQQGWRRPLLAWLSFARDRCKAAGDAACAAARQRRIDYVLGSTRPDR
ncbi:hypothetical protein [Sulfuricystis multivorans]|uniref:hypothetical protein n=1 Tax=Sulfuricystis multivorans TaxID=2211108 RepID=UPI000F83288E|nr:hypothetical protein [Sulfuricystis multivorans]